MQLLEDQDSADEEFWNQDFFAEEEKDREFEASESEQEDVPDSDFSEEVIQSSRVTAKSQRTPAGPTVHHWDMINLHTFDCSELVFSFTIAELQDGKGVCSKTCKHWPSRLSTIMLKSA